MFEIFKKAESEGLAVTVTFSYLREFMLKPVEKLLDELEEWCRNRETFLEIAANDWGLLELLRERKEWKKEKEDLRIMIEELKADNQPYHDELAFVKKVQRCADIARRDRKMPETDTSGLSEEKRELQEQESKQMSSIHGRLVENQKLIEEEKAKNRKMKKKRSNEISL